MSRFSGKCDIYDVLIAIREMDDKSDWSKIKIRKYIDELDDEGWYKTMDLNINSKNNGKTIAKIMLNGSLIISLKFLLAKFNVLITIHLQ